MAGLLGRCGAMLILLKKLHWHPSSPWLPVPNLLHHHRQATCVMLQPHVMMSQVSPSTCLTTKNCSSLCRNATTCDDPVEFLDYLDKQSLQTCSPNDTASYIVQLGHCQMQFLRTLLPWLEASYHVGYKQLLMADRLEEVSQRVKEHEHFIGLCTSLEQSYQDCDDKLLTYSALMLLYLGVHPESSIIHKLLFELRDRIPSMSVQETSIVARFYLAMPMLDTITGRKIVNQLAKFLDTCQDWSGEDFSSLCVTTSKMIRLLSKDRLLAFFRLARQLTEEPQYLNDPKYIENLSVALIKIPDRVDVNNVEINKILTQLKDATLRNLNLLSYRGLRSVCNAIQYLRWQYSDDFRLKCEERAVSLLHDDCGIREIINLLTVCNSRTDRHILDVFEEKLYDKLEDCDGHLIGNVARCFNEVDPYHFSHRTFCKLQHVAADQGHAFSTYSGAMAHSLASLFVRRPDCELEVHDKLTSFFLQYLDFMDHDMRYVSSVLLYLMLVPGCPGLPESVFERMLSSIPRWNMRHVSVTVLRLNSIGRRLSPICERQIDVLQVVFQMRFLELLPKVTTLNELCRVTRRMIHIEQNPTLLDNDVFRTVIDKYKELSSEDMDEITLNNVTGVFSNLKYYLPSLFEDMVKSINRMEVTLELKTSMQLLRMLGKVGYRPEEFDKFVSALLKIWQESYSQQNYRIVLFILCYLSRFHCFPQKELKHVFSMDFLQTVDREVKGN